MTDVLLEKLVINGIDLRYDGVGSVPSGGSCTVNPVWVTEVVTVLSGKQATFRAEQQGAKEIAIDGGESFAVSGEVKRQLEAALMSFGTVTVVETLSEPTQERTWAGYLTELTLKEVEGAERQLYFFKFKLRQEPQI